MNTPIKRFWFLCLSAAGAMLAVAATITFTTLHPQYGETTKILEEKRTEALARLGDSLAGFGTNILRVDLISGGGLTYNFDATQFTADAATNISVKSAALLTNAQIKAGANLVPAVGDLAAPADGDLWYNSTSSKFRKRQGGVSTDLDTTGGSNFIGLGGEPTSIANMTDGATAVSTDRLGAERSPFGATLNRYLTVDALKNYVVQNGSFNISGQSFLIVGTNGTAELNATDLVNGYATAKAATPYGAALSATNRFTLLLLPGMYSLTDAALNLDSNFIDLVGIGGNRDDVLLTSTGRTMRITVTGSPDLTLANFRLHTSVATPTSQANKFAYNVETTPTSQVLTFRHINLRITTLNASAGWRSGVAAIGYYQDVDCSTFDGSFGWGLAGAENCGVSGYFVRCTGRDHAFGSSSAGSSASTTLDGTLIDCEAREFAFGSVPSGATAVLSGFFQRCRATGGTTTRGVFGAGTTGANATLSGTFLDCVSTSTCVAFGGHTSSGARTVTLSGNFFGCYSAGSGAFGGAFSSATATHTLSGVFVSCTGVGNAFGGGVNATLSGSFLNCSGTSQCFGGGSLAATLSGTFVGCAATANSFGGVSTGVNASQITGTMNGCTATSNGYCGSGTGTGGTISSTAVMTSCTATTGAFAGGTTGGSIAGTVVNCVATGNSFAGGSTTGGTISGNVFGCTAGANSFAGGGTTGGTLSGEVSECRSTAASPSHCFASAATNKGTLSGRMQNCRMNGFLNATVTGRLENVSIIATGTDQTAITVGAGARLYGVTAVHTGTGKSVDAAVGVNIKAAHCRLSTDFGANVTNDVGTPFNVQDSDIQ